MRHPSSQIEREYAVRALGKVDKNILDRLLRGVQLEDGEAHFDRIKYIGGQGANQWYHVVLHEGRNREVRRLWESQGVTVSRLSRVRFGDIVLPRSLRRGQWVELSAKEVKRLVSNLDILSNKI
jgi:23S rRNA pseudouridine2605 synthase